MESVWKEAGLICLVDVISSVGASDPPMANAFQPNFHGALAAPSIMKVISREPVRTSRPPENGVPPNTSNSDL